MRKKNSQHTKLFSVTEHLLEEKKQDDMKNFQDLNEKKNTDKKSSKK